MTTQTATNTFPADVSATLSPIWDKITGNLFAKTKAYGANSTHWRNMGKACASLTLEQLQAVVASVQASLPALAEDHATRLVKSKTVTVTAEDLPAYIDGLKRSYQRDTHRDIGTYLVPAYNEAQAQQHGKAAKLAHYYRASGKAGESSAIHAKPAPAKRPKTRTATGKGSAIPPLLQPAPSVPEQADTLAHVVAGMTDNRNLSKNDVFAMLESAFSGGLVTLADVTAWAQNKLDALEKADAKAFTKQAKELDKIGAFQDLTATAQQVAA